MMMWDAGFGGGFAMGWGGMLLFWVLVIVALAVLLKWALGFTGLAGPAAGSPALETLKSRYARGEIDREQFLQLKRDLE